MAKSSIILQTIFSNPKVVPTILLNKIQSKVSYYVFKTHSLAPETVNIYPTFRCNLKCEMCFEKFAKVEKEMNKIDWFKIIEELKRFKPKIHISGGEPFVYADIVEIIRYIKNQNLYLHITTNGTFLEDYAEELVKLKVDRIDISIDGPKDLHDRIRGVEGTFDKIINGLKRLNELKRHVPILKINSIINLSNPNTMHYIIHIAKEYRTDVVQFIYPLYLDDNAIEIHKKFIFERLKRNINYWCYASRYQPVGGDFHDIQTVINKLSREKVIINIFPNFNAEQFSAFYNSPEKFDRFYKGKCRAMRNTATILPNGNIESCPDYIVGNITEDRFLNFWNNQKMVELRRLILDKKFFSVCRACCFYYQ